MKTKIRSQALWIGVSGFLLYGVIGWSVGPVFGEETSDPSATLCLNSGYPVTRCDFNDLKNRVERLERLLKLDSSFKVQSGNIFFTPEDQFDSIDLGDVIRSARRVPKVSGPDYEIKDEKKK